MPIPDQRRLGEYAVKAGHAAGRLVASAPEQRAARRLARHAPATSGGPRVAFFTPRDWAVHVQWEAMLAQALRLRGADVSFIGCGGGLDLCDRANCWEAPPMPCRSCTRYVADSVAAHGFARVDIRDGWIDDDPGDWPALDELSIADLAGVQADGLDLGDLTRIPVSWFLMRASLDDDPLAPSTWRALLRSARRVARGFRAALDRVQPDVVVLLNGMFMFDAVAWAICRERGIDVVTYERGFIKETLLFRRGAPAGLTLLDDEWSSWRSQPLTGEEGERLDAYLAERQHGRRTVDRYWDRAVFAEPERTRPGRLAVLFPNLTWDSAVIGQDDVFPSIQDWLARSVRVFEGRPDAELVIRLHPAEVKLPGKQTREPLGQFLTERFGRLPDNVRVIAPDDDQSSYPLMKACDLGLVYTSTTGLELALAGKPVIVAGRTHYRGKGFTLDASSPDHFVELLQRALGSEEVPPQSEELARRYAYLFFFRTPVGSLGVEEHVSGLARITVTSLGELAPGVDPELDQLCRGILEGGPLTAGVLRAL